MQTLTRETQEDRKPESRSILGVRIDATSYSDATRRIMRWAKQGESRYVCITSVHGVIESQDNEAFRRVENEADLVTPDGMPLVWALRRLGVPGASRVYGPNLTLHLCEAAAREGVPIALYGGTDESLADFAGRLTSQFPGLNIVCQIAPPFRALTEEEDAAYTRQIVESGARLVLVGIGCPKQELWMAAHKSRLPAVQVGVGAAFDFHSGRVRQAPGWIGSLGLEWFFRLVMEPKRLWKRYSTIVPRFITLFGRQLLAERRRSGVSYNTGRVA